jgi:hypothetical protein
MRTLTLGESGVAARGSGQAALRPDPPHDPQWLDLAATTGGPAARIVLGGAAGQTARGSGNDHVRPANSAAVLALKRRDPDRHPRCSR